MALSDPLGYDGLTYSGKEFRQAVAALQPTPGVVTGFGVTAQGSPNATVAVAAGTVVVAATAAGEFGSYTVGNDASLNSGSFAPTAGNGRWDYLILRITTGVPALEIVEGTPAGSPAAPTITGDNYATLALVKLPGGTTNVTNAMITDARTMTGHWANAWGIISSATATANSGGFTTITDYLSGCDLPASWPAGRRVRLWAHTTLQASGAASQVNAVLREGSTVLGWATDILPVNLNAVTLHPFALITPTAGAHNYKLSVSGNTNAIVVASATASSATAPGPTYLVAEDLGPAANPA